MVIVKKISEFYKLIVDFEFDVDLQKWQIGMLENIITKLTISTKNKLLEDVFITIYVNNLKDCDQNINKSNIVQFKDHIYIYLLKLIIESKKEFRESENEIKILLSKFNKEKIETENVIHSLICLIYFTDTKQSLSINTKKIDSLYTGEFTKFAKNVNKSIVTTLTGKRKNDKFIIFPECNKKFVPIDKISKSYLTIGNKSINISCPICNETFKIDKSNIEKQFIIHENKFIQFNCKHTNSNVFVGTKPFIFNLKDKLGENTKFENIEKIMFFINNFKHFKYKE